MPVRKPGDESVMQHNELRMPQGQLYVWTYCSKSAAVKPLPTIPFQAGIFFLAINSVEAVYFSMFTQLASLPCVHVLAAGQYSKPKTG
jgi:hypothetical protein